MKPRDVVCLLILVTVIGTVKAEPEPIFFIDLWKPLEAIIKLIGKIDFGNFGNIIKIKGDSDDDKDSKKDSDSKKDDDSKKEYEKESDNEKDEDDSDDDWEFDHDFEFLDRNLQNVPNSEISDPVAQSYIARSGGLLDKVVSETGAVVEEVKEDLGGAAKRSVTDTNKRNVNFELRPKESIRVKRGTKDPGRYEGARNQLFHKVINDMFQIFAGFNKLPLKEKRSNEVTNYRTTKRHSEELSKTELDILQQFFSDWRLDIPIDSTIVEKNKNK